jgi:hypothetical protein
LTRRWELAQTFGEDRAAAIYRSSLAGLVSLRRQVIAQRIDYGGLIGRR